MALPKAVSLPHGEIVADVLEGLAMAVGAPGCSTRQILD
jgi:hypothetical protein